MVSVYEMSSSALLIVLAVALQVGSEGVSMVVESFNLRSERKTNLTCSRVKELTVNGVLIPGWHCIGGTMAKYREPGMWISATSPVIKVAVKSVPFVIGYDGYDGEKASTTFQLGDEMQKQLTASASLVLKSKDMKNDTLNVTMTYIQFETCELPPTPTGNVAASTIIAVIEGIILAAVALYAGFSLYQKRNNLDHELVDGSSEQIYAVDTDE